MTIALSRSGTRTSPAPGSAGFSPAGAQFGGAHRAGLGATPGDAKQHNRTLVLQTLSAAGPMSRADLARATGLTKVTVSGLVAELLSDGFATELGVQESQRPGKPAILVDLARTAFSVLALDLSDDRRFRGALLDLDGTVIERAETPLDGAVGDAASERAVRLALDLLERASVPVLGIGVGTPGVVDADGVVRTAANLGWHQLDLRGVLAERTGITTVVMNDANLAALAELRFGDATDDFIVITIGHGVGSGLVVAGRPVVGTRFASGEIGQVMVGTDLGIEAPYAREQVLEHWLSVPSLTSALAAHPDQREAVLREAGQRLGIALAPVVGVLNLAEVVLAGPIELVDGVLAEATLEILRRRTMPDSHDTLVLRTSRQGDDLILRGATAVVLGATLGIT
ncbi:ROK family transcriptional regulator [Leucobacter musarum]|uniref:ROK family transcriptional regulator n=1 Tax=Leucobacter musarum TaxID=1930747 RepID=UPI0009E871D1|nr:ROK family transcriptional regulator [Leucobacter musarum]